MPRRPRARRSRPRRNLPPTPPQPGVAGSTVESSASRRGRIAASERPRRLIERDAPYIAAELRRIVMISTACIGLLVLLVLADRLG